MKETYLVLYPPLAFKLHVSPTFSNIGYTRSLNVSLIYGSTKSTNTAAQTIYNKINKYLLYSWFHSFRVKELMNL
jgi:hypothetical protein